MQANHWDEFWEQGHITTFGSTLRNNYTGELKRFWEEIYAKSRESDSILDLATGNGALPCIAFSTLNKLQKEAKIYATDAAQIPPIINAPWDIKEARQNINFLGNTPCEKLNFHDEKFHLITSQFGIEYSDWEQSLPEVFRVLRPEHGAHFICHDTDSSLISATRNEIGIYSSAIDVLKIFDAAVNFCSSYNSTLSHEKNSATNLLNDSINKFRSLHVNQELAQLMISDISQHLRQLKFQSAKEVADQLNSRKSTFYAAYSRQKDMLDAALCHQDVSSILKTSRRLGFSAVSSQKFTQTDDLIGIYISLTK